MFICVTAVNINMLHSLKPFICPQCKFAYSSREVAKYNIARFPRILNCNHSLCETCLQAASKNDKFTCPTCKQELELPVDTNGSSALLPDVHALGIISANLRNSLPSLKVKYGHSYHLNRSRSQESLKKSVSTFVCGHCHKNEAQWQCDECQLNFCSVCFGDVHKDMKLRKKHEGKKIFAESYNSMVQEGCIEHENKTVEFYCEVDDTLTCSYCMLMGDHVGHEVKTLLDKNKSCAEDLRNVLDDVSKIQRQLKYTDHLLCEAIPKEKVDVSHFVKEIHDYFHSLHSLLQTRELELINEVMKLSESNIKPLEEMRLKITGLERDLAARKKDAEAVINNPCLAISAPVLLKKLQDSKNLPCYLVPINDSDAEIKFSQIDLDLKSEVEDQIKCLGHLKSNVKPMFELKSENELPGSFIPPEIPEDFDVFPDVESCTTSADNFSEDSLSTTNSKFSSTLATYKCKEFVKMQPEKVSVSHIKSPSSFFVYRYSDIRKLTVMSEAIDKYCKHEGRKNKPTEINLGDLYLVKYSADNRWYRARALKILDSECKDGRNILVSKVPPVTSEGEEIVTKSKTQIKVFYIDFGNTETVSIQNVRNILPRFLNLPGLAKECSLVDINPINGAEWGEECTKFFSKFVSNKLVIMKIYEERNNVLYVDLTQIPDNDISHDVPVSVRDALVFLELAVFPSNVKATSPNKQNKSQKRYFPPESLKVNASVWGIVSHVNDPYDFYIQQMSTASYLSKLIFEMNETYNNANELLHNIFVPYVGMMCAAQFSLDKQWYRAEVIGLPGGAKVEVKYVDFGNSEVIHHKYLRKLFDQFTKLNVQAIPCRLAHVSYNQEKCWSSEANEWLTNEVSRKQLTIKSLGTIPGSHKAEVVLYYSDNEFDICINSLIVQKKLATSTGQFGSSQVKVKKEIMSPKKDQNRTNISPEKKNNLHDIIPSLVLKQNNPTFVQPEISHAVEINNNFHEIETSKLQLKKYPTLASSDSDKIADSIEVHVSHVEDPGCFFINTVGDGKKLNLLMQELQKTYENLKSEMNECSIGKAYAVYSRVQKKWFRGSILSKLSDDAFKVRLVDYGNFEEILLKDICKLDDRFTQDDAFCVRCHLDGIIPPGGSEQWPQTTCDAFKRAVEQYETFHLSCKGEIDKINNSLPSDLLVENLIIGGALEPSKLEFLSISEELLRNGLALPLRKKCGSLFSLQTNKTEPNSKNLNTKENIKEMSSKKEEENKRDIEIEKNRNNIDLIESTYNHKINELKNCVNSVKSHLDIKEDKKDLEIKKEMKPDKLVNSEINVEKAHSKSPVINIKPPHPTKPKFQWKPAVLPMETSFRALVTNIGEDGSIFLQVLKEGSSQVDVIKKALEFKFTRNTYEPLNELPPIGEACIAKFSVDDLWYRAEVISTYPNQVKVNFVDYGNNEIVPLEDIRLEIIMQSFPRQCHECILFGVQDKIKWDNELTTFLHNQLVDEEVIVDVKGPLENGRIPCEIKLISGVDIGKLLLDIGCDASEDIDDSEDVNKLSVSQTNLDIFKTFSTAIEWREGHVFPVCITNVPSPNIVYLQPLKIPSPKDDYEKEHNKQCEAFLQLITDLRKKADSFPKLKEPLPGMPCCAKYSYDENWYRCEITDLTEDGAVVLYVDYGNTETVPVNDLRELENSFIDFPVQLHFCQLHGMKPVEEDWNPVVHELLIKKLLVPDQDFIAKVVVPGEISQIDLLAEIDGEYKIVYEDLANDCLIILDK